VIEYLLDRAQPPIESVSGYMLYGPAVQQAVLQHIRPS